MLCNVIHIFTETAFGEVHRTIDVTLIPSAFRQSVQYPMSLSLSRYFDLRQQ